MKNFLPRFDKKQIILVGVMVLIAFAMLNLNTRLAELFQIKNQLTAAELQHQRAVDENIRLKEKLAYAQSDKAVDEWARKQGHMALPGDQVIVPIPDGSVRIISTPAPVQEIAQASNWEVWQALFFGE